MSLENELVQRVNGPMAARVMVAVAEANLRGARGLSRQQIADRLDLSREVVDRLVGRLKEADLLVEVDGDFTGFMPARPPGEIALAEVLAAFRSDDAAGERGRGALGALLAELESSAHQRTAEVTLAELVDPPAPRRGGRPPS